MGWKTFEKVAVLERFLVQRELYALFVRLIWKKLDFRSGSITIDTDVGTLIHSDGSIAYGDTQDFLYIDEVGAAGLIQFVGLNLLVFSSEVELLLKLQGEMLWPLKHILAT